MPTEKKQREIFLPTQKPLSGKSAEQFSTKNEPRERFSAIQKKGVRVSLKEALLECFVEMGGKAALLKWAKQNQTEYYKLTAKHTIPTRVEMSGVDGEAIQLEMTNAAETARDKLASAIERRGDSVASQRTH